MNQLRFIGILACSVILMSGCSDRNRYQEEEEDTVHTVTSPLVCLESSENQIPGCSSCELPGCNCPGCNGITDGFAFEFKHEAFKGHPS